MPCKESRCTSTESARAMNEAKDQLKHGEFGPWLRRTFDIGERWAREPSSISPPRQTINDDIRHTSSRSSSDCIHHPIHRRVLPVLDLDPVLGPAALIGAVAMLRDKALK